MSPLKDVLLAGKYAVSLEGAGSRQRPRETSSKHPGSRYCGAPGELASWRGLSPVICERGSSPSVSRAPSPPYPESRRLDAVSSCALTPSRDLRLISEPGASGPDRLPASPRPPVWLLSELTRGMLKHS